MRSSLRAASLVVVKVLATPDVVYSRHHMFQQQANLEERWKKTEHQATYPSSDLVQVNQSYLRPLVVRGLHYQLKPSEQGKLVFVVRGRVFDVAVDIRRCSPHFGRWVAAELGPGEALWIPPGFAHGLQSLEETHYLYLVTKEFDPQRGRCIRWDDPAIAVRWPAPNRAILSQKDRNCPPLA
jgi:dTDP-4-dehydrorhamnose 3,5-epimerase